MRSYTILTITNELKFDHERTCDHCGKQFNVVFRIYGKGSSSYRNSLLLTLFGSKHSKEAEAASKAETLSINDSFAQNQSKQCYHRCTHCGFYSKNDIDIIQMRWIKFRRNQYAIIHFVSGLAIWFTMLVLFLSIRKKPTHFEEILLLLSPFIALLIVYIYNKIHTKKVESYLQDVNNSGIVLKWLLEWNKNSTKLLSPFLTHKHLDLYQREKAYLELYNLQHKYDPGAFRNSLLKILSRS